MSLYIMLRGLLPSEGMKPDETCSAQDKRLKTYPEGPCLGPVCRNKESNILLKVPVRSTGIPACICQTACLEKRAFRQCRTQAGKQKLSSYNRGLCQIIMGFLQLPGNGRTKAGGMPRM